MQSKAFEKLYLLQLMDIYSAEKQLSEALPKMLKSAKARDLKIMFRELLDKTKNQLTRIENIFKKIKNAKPEGENCNTMEDLIDEAEEWLEETGNNNEIDAGLILINKKITHYEIAVYESLILYARRLAQHRTAEILEESLAEQYIINDRLDEIFEDAGMAVKSS